MGSFSPELSQLFSFLFLLLLVLKTWRRTNVNLLVCNNIFVSHSGLHHETHLNQLDPLVG